ncbi:hypothetical protein R3P38DRAFT_3231246 [Favolaschia claudopus]|uniref:Uncharacterized protein n=1 Tax=Favolaschia claudopus TaxID=2862362 RepID=A0AAV9ZKX9_9AGAR
MRAIFIRHYPRALVLYARHITTTIFYLQPFERAPTKSSPAANDSSFFFLPSLRWRPSHLHIILTYRDSPRLRLHYPPTSTSDVEGRLPASHTPSLRRQSRWDIANPAFRLRFLRPSVALVSIAVLAYVRRRRPVSSPKSWFRAPRHPYPPNPLPSLPCTIATVFIHPGLICHSANDSPSPPHLYLHTYPVFILIFIFVFVGDVYPEEQTRGGYFESPKQRGGYGCGCEDAPRLRNRVSPPSFTPSRLSPPSWGANFSSSSQRRHVVPTAILSAVSCALLVGGVEGTAVFLFFVRLVFAVVSSTVVH